MDIKLDYSDVSFKNDGRLKLLIIVGTRPEIIRLAAVINKCRKYFDTVLAHTGQNYDYNLNGIFFRDLGCKSFDMGGDELLGFGDSVDNSVPKWHTLEQWEEYARRVTGRCEAVAYDAFVLYMNDLAALLRSLGYESVRMWNDDVYRYADTGWREVAKLDTSIDVQYWTHITNDSKNTAAFYIDKGHGVYNFAAPYTYYTLYPDKAPTKKAPDEIIAEWTPYVFDDVNPENIIDAPNEKVKGAGMCLWTDTPDAMTEDELLEKMRPHFTAIARKCLGE